MPFIQRLGAVAIMALSLAACRGSGVKPPEVKLNPAPKQRYEITLTVEDPPVAIEKVGGSIQFDIEDTSCMPTMDRIAGIQPKSSFEQPVVFRRRSDYAFVGYVFADGLLDEDYYGRGVCRWGMTGVMARIHVGGVSQTAVLRTEQIVAEGVRIGVCSRDVGMSDICIFPLGGVAGEDNSRSFVVKMKSRKVFK